MPKLLEFLEHLKKERRLSEHTIRNYKSDLDQLSVYMIGEFEKSQNDIDKVLNLEKRHFGALAGQGLVNIQLKNYEKAILSYQMAEKIYPTMRSPKIMIKQIQDLIKRESI